MSNGTDYNAEDKVINNMLQSPDLFYDFDGDMRRLFTTRMAMEGQKDPQVMQNMSDYLWYSRIVPRRANSEFLNKMWEDHGEFFNMIFGGTDRDQFNNLMFREIPKIVADFQKTPKVLEKEWIEDSTLVANKIGNTKIFDSMDRYFDYLINYKKPMKESGSNFLPYGEYLDVKKQSSIDKVKNKNGK